MFKIGDVISVGGVMGIVKEFGLFGMMIIIVDNIVMIVGNNKIFLDNIVNYSVMLYCCVDLIVKIVYSVDVVDVINCLKM